MMFCSFCAHLKDPANLDAAAKVTVINGHAVCLDHMPFVTHGDWLDRIANLNPSPTGLLDLTGLSYGALAALQNALSRHLEVTLSGPPPHPANTFDQQAYSQITRQIATMLRADVS